MDVQGVNVTPARVVPLKVAAAQDAARDLLRYLGAPIRIVGDAATDLSHALASSLVTCGQEW